MDLFGRLKGIAEDGIRETDPCEPEVLSDRSIPVLSKEAKSEDRVDSGASDLSETLRKLAYSTGEMPEVSYEVFDELRSVLEHAKDGFTSAV